MKEITRIHLAKTAFSVEIDAKKSLEKYLNSIQKNMHADAEAMKEIAAKHNDGFYVALIDSLPIETKEKKRLLRDADIHDYRT